MLLSLNAGSSSVKVKLFDETKEMTVVAKGQISRIGERAELDLTLVDGRRIHKSVNAENHADAIEIILQAFMDPEFGVLKGFDEIKAVGHRVLHGGENITESVLVTPEVKEVIRANIPLGPLHNPANLQGIEACEKVMPHTPNVAVFDTAFHQTMPAKAYMYGVPYKYYEELHVRRYGFHGTSHRYVSKRACEFLGLDRNNTRVITCHIGNGSSMAAIMNGKCVDTSMGIAPLEGVIMGTRSGSMDPAVVQFIANNKNMTVDQVLNMCNKESGLLGISGVSSNMIDINLAADAGNERAILAREMLCYGVTKYIGAYAAAMGGVDVIVYTGGIGENDDRLRANVMSGFEFLGAKIDPARNNGCRSESVISTDDSTVKICVIPTDEELVIANDTMRIISAHEKN